MRVRFVEEFSQLTWVRTVECVVVVTMVELGWKTMYGMMSECGCDGRRVQAKWPEQSDELLGLIVNSLRAVEGAVAQGGPEPRRRPQSAQKITVVLEKAPKHLRADVIGLVPKLVDLSEHSSVACSLLERLQRADADAGLRSQVGVVGGMFVLVVGSFVSGLGLVCGASTQAAGCGSGRGLRAVLGKWWAS